MGPSDVATLLLFTVCVCVRVCTRYEDHFWPLRPDLKASPSLRRSYPSSATVVKSSTDPSAPGS